MNKISNSPPWWGWVIIVCGFIGSGFVAYSQIFPNPAVTELHEEFKVHEATPAHGVKEFEKKLQQIYVIQQIMLNDMDKFEILLKEINGKL